MNLASVAFEHHKFQTLICQPLGEQAILVTLNRPEVHNAYNALMVSELGKVITISEATAAIKVVILTGAGERVFCAGADLKEAFINSGNGLLNQHGGYNPLQHMPRRKIWIAALNGHAFGGGLELALQCDLLVAEEQVKLSLPETRHSLLPVGGAITRLSAMLPGPVLKEMILAGGALQASRAWSLGLINRVTDRQNLLLAARELADQIISNAPLAVQAANVLIEHSLYGDSATLEAHIQQELEQLQQSQDFAESGRAFMEKRKPQWKGK